MKPNNRSEKEKYWRSQIAQAAEFQGSIQAYCQTHGISQFTFRYWQRKLTQEKAQSVVRRPFVQVEIQNPSPEQFSTHRLPDPHWVAEVILHLSRGLS